MLFLLPFSIIVGSSYFFLLPQSQAKLNAVESQVNAIVASVFSERYRDVIEDVRGKCVEELGVWIKEYKYVCTYVHMYVCTYGRL